MTSGQEPHQTQVEPAEGPTEDVLPERPRRPARRRGEPNPALDPRLVQLERRSRPTSRTSDVSLMVIGLVAFFFGVAMHFWVATSVLDSDAESSESVAEVTATPASRTPTVAPTTVARATATPLPDRTECDEIRGTQYRSVAEREFFLENCTGTQ